MTTRDIASWKPARRPDFRTLRGRFVRLEKLDPLEHGDALWMAFAGPCSDPHLWDYLWSGPFTERSDFNNWLNKRETDTSPGAYAVADKQTGTIEGILTLTHFIPQHGRVEIGCVFGTGMQRSPKSTEAVYMLAKEAFDLGIRRLEWSCHSRNGCSKNAARRFGFTYEGLLRQCMVLTRENRDSCVYSILDMEWPLINGAFEKWLRPENFAADGQQIQTLESFRS